MKQVQIGDVFGELKSVHVGDEQTIADALTAAGLAISEAQQLIAQSTSQPVNVLDSPTDGEVYLLTSNQTSGY